MVLMLCQETGHDTVQAQRLSNVDLRRVGYGFGCLLLLGVRLGLLSDELMRNELHVMVKIREPNMATHRRLVIVANYLARCRRLGGACAIVRKVTG